jgi:hypothetical protein
MIDSDDLYQLYSSKGLASLKMFVAIGLWSNSAEYASALIGANLLDRGIDSAPTAMANCPIDSLAAGWPGLYSVGIMRHGVTEGHIGI